MFADRYRQSAITCAVTGGDVLPSQAPFLPKGADHIAREAVAAARAGATAVHLHARSDDGRPSADPALFADIAERIRAECDVVINVTTGGTVGMTPDERLAGVVAAKPEIATFNLGTINYIGFPTPARWPKVETDWERQVLESSSSSMFVNTLDDLRRFASILHEAGIKPELEAYDAGHLSMARFLVEEGTLEPPLRVQLVLGVLGGADNSVDHIFHLRSLAYHTLGEHLGSLGLAATGYPMQLRGAAIALACGMDCRVGMEDSIRVHRDRIAESNVEFVEAAVTVATRVGRPIATPTQLRADLEASIAA
jgi:uncharacterized protein (DUF849 family)